MPFLGFFISWWEFSGPPVPAAARIQRAPGLTLVTRHGVEDETCQASGKSQQHPRQRSWSRSEPPRITQPRSNGDVVFLGVLVVTNGVSHFFDVIQMLGSIVFELGFAQTTVTGSWS